MRTYLCGIGFALLMGIAHTEAAEWKAGVAVRAITPKEPTWMAGYASRTKPAEGKEQDLFVKALVLEDPAGSRAVLLTSDLIGIPRSLGLEVAGDVERKLNLPRERLMLTVSHTHCGPVVRDNLEDAYSMPPDEAKKIAPYTQQLRRWMVEAIVQAVANVKPARLSLGKGIARFAVNRRNNVEKEVPSLRSAGSPLRGPIDHDVPVLKVTSPGGDLLAVVFGYACHNTTMQYFRWCGDYAGFAQEQLQNKHKGAVAMFWSGCGGDQNPLPRGKIELCRAYGKQLAEAVEAVLAEKMEPISTDERITCRYAEIALPYARLPDKKQLAADALSKNAAIRSRAKRFQALLEQGGKIPDGYLHYPIQVWKLGDHLTWVALGGEVVVDYSLRLKRELAGKAKVWVTGYANDVMAYVPSERVLKEGGYEGESSMVYYGLPSKWAPDLEDRIVAKVRELSR